MKQNLPVTNKEYDYAASQIITSTTDLKGAVTYVNQDFLDISGFSSDELMGKNHNMVRHPDMPPAAFADLWTTIKAGKPWMGLVKNRCKSGDYYWVDAFVTPVTKNGVITGYESTRIKPAKLLTQRAECLYKRIMAGKKLKLKRLGLLPTQVITGSVLQLLVFAALYLSGSLSLPVALLAWLGVSLVWGGISYYQLRDFKKLLKRSKSIVDNKIAQLAYYGKVDDVSQVRFSIRMLVAKLRTVVTRLSQSTDSLSAQAEMSATIARESFNNIHRQQQEIEMVATAVNEMSATVQEVSRNTVKAAESSNQVRELATAGALTISDAIGIIDSLDSRVTTAAESILQLKKDSENIGGVLDVIRGIAEQTNLLALNAAIEAARAGEQGRGFAVVADEVRTLASRSHDATQDIQDMIERLHQGVSVAVKDMQDVKVRASEGVEQVEAAAESLAEISGAVNTINDMNTQIAAATEEQSAVAEELSRNIENINQMSAQTSNSASQTMETSEELLNLSQKLTSMVENFSEVG